MALFPQLVAGPIVRYSDVEKELPSPKTSWKAAELGASLFMAGFCKKVWIANNIAPGADWAFSLSDPTLALAWFGIVAYTLQIYFDFSGYSDMAIGLGLIIGFHFPANFRTPYLASNIADFWQRWHVTMSSFFRDYLYIPLGGNRLGLFRTMLNLILTMALAGLWHGAGWTFVIWGGFHGCMLALHRLWTRSALAIKIRPLGFFAGFSSLLTLLAVMAGWVLFRAESLTSAAAMYRGALGLNGIGPGLLLEGRYDLTFWLIFALGIAYVFLLDGRRATSLESPVVRWVWYGLFVGALHELGCQTSNPFLYFQF